MKHMRGIRFGKCAALLLAVMMLLSSGCAAAEKTVLLSFTGDVTLGGKDEGRNRSTSFESYAAEKGYDYFFANFREMFENDDQTVINLEGVLSTSASDERKKTHTFWGDPALAEILPRSGIDAAGITNNHIKDFGAQGIRNTKQALEKNGIAWFQDFTYYIFEKDGIKVAFFALQNSILYSKSKQLYSKIQELREKKGVGAVVACWHTGTEYKRKHNKDTETRVKSLVENGVDLVIINHPHVTQGMSIFNNRSIFYSLGNFVFGGNPNIRAGKNSKDPLAISLYSLVVQARLTFSNEGKYLGQQVTVYPVYSSGANPDYQVGDKPYPENNYQPIRLTLKQAAPVYECFTKDTAGTVPEMTENDGYAEIVFPYIPAFDGVMIPEGGDYDDGMIGLPEASSPKLTREGKNSAGN